MSTYDYTAQIFSLQSARADMQAAKAKNRALITAKYKNVIADEIKAADQAAELHFAGLLRAANESGVPQSMLRSEVLRTNVWNRWTYWRDLANIEPERKVFQDAKEAKRLADQPYRWSEDFTMLYWLKDRAGKPLKEEIVLNMDFDMLHLPDHLPEQRPYIDSVFGGPAVLKKLAEEAILEQHGAAKEASADNGKNNNDTEESHG